MKLKDLFEASAEKSTAGVAPIGGFAGKCTTAQAAAKLGISTGRVRQLVQSGELKPYKPEKGRKENWFDVAEIDTFAKKDRPITGRPKGSKEGSGDEKKDKKEDKKD